MAPVSRASSGLVVALARAYRRGLRAGVAVVGTDLVMYYAALGLPTADIRLPLLWQRTFRPIRSGGRGHDDPQPQPRPPAGSAFDDDVAVEVDMLLRQAAFTGANDPTPLRSRRPSPVFSPAVRHAVYEAVHEASRDHLVFVGRRRLLVALLAIRDSPARELMAQWCPDGHLLLATRIRTAPTYHRDGDYTPDGRPVFPLVERLRVCGAIPGQTDGDLPAFERFLARRFTAWQRRRYTRHGAWYGHPLLVEVDIDARVHATRAGRHHVSSADVLLSVLDAHEQIRAAGADLPTADRPFNAAGEILRAHGIGYQRAARAALTLPPCPTDAEDDLDGLPTRGWPRRARTVTLPYGRSALAALRSASLSAHRAGHPFAGTTHLLAALLTDDAGPAARLLHSLGARPAGIRTAAADLINP